MSEQEPLFLPSRLHLDDVTGEITPQCEWTPLVMSPQDEHWIALREANMRELCRMFQLTPEQLGEVDERITTRTTTSGI